MRPLGNTGKGGRSCCLGLVAIALVIDSALSAPSPLAAAETDEFKVCADPNNLPFSNADGARFRNTARRRRTRQTRDFGWWAQRRRFVRSTLNAELCDVVVGVPVDYRLVETTRPYRSNRFRLASRPQPRRRVDQGTRLNDLWSAFT
jgi:mxaJ protein